MEPQYWSIELVPGLMPAEQKLLKNQGIEDTKELLKRADTGAKKQALASQLNLNQKHLRKWIALADLARIPSVGCQYCGLLLHSGVISVAHLAQMPFYRLYRQIVRLQVTTLRRRDLSPPLEQVKQWVEEAKILCNSSV